jgi:hypothetical protein
MDHINADPGPNPEAGDANVESDRLRPIVRRVRRSTRRWPAGFVLAVIAVLAASGLAFGAQVLPALQSSDQAAGQMQDQPTPVVLGGEDDPTAPPTLIPEDSPSAGPTSPDLEPTLSPTDPPTPIPTDVPTATPSPLVTSRPTSHPTLPPSGYLSFAVQPEGGCGRLNWASFDDPSKAYYRIVRSTDASVEWPLGAGDTLVASSRDSSQLTLLDCPAAGTYTYRVFVDKATSAGYVVLVSSHSLTITLAGSAPAPTATPVAVDMGPLTVTANPNGTYTLSWNAYTGSLAISSYALCYTTNENVVFGYVEHFGGVISVAKTATSWTGTFPWAATLRLKVEALYTPPSGAVQKAGETQVSILPYTGATPTPTTTPTPTPAPTATPVVNLGDFVTAQDNHDGTFTFSWNAYTGPLSVAYIISGTTTASGSFGYFEDTHLWSDSNPSDLTWTGPIASGSWRIKVEAISTSTGTMIKAAETDIYYLPVP